MSSNPGKSAPQNTLPPAKMRALISLYHQVDTFVTHENLSERIDRAFLEQGLLSKAFTPTTSLSDLKRVVAERRSAPRISEWDPDSPMDGPEQMGLGWSDSKSLREQRVIEALYGVDKGRKPGLEVLQESGERIQQDLFEDSKKRSS